MVNYMQYNLKDGRVLGYAEYGDASSKPILLTHETPGIQVMYTYMEVA